MYSSIMYSSWRVVVKPCSWAMCFRLFITASLTACVGTSAETTKLSETAVTEKATETESESETAEAKEYDLDDVKDYVEGIDDYKIYIKDADKLEQKDLLMF